MQFSIAVKTANPMLRLIRKGIKNKPETSCCFCRNSWYVCILNIPHGVGILFSSQKGYSRLEEVQREALRVI